MTALFKSYVRMLAGVAGWKLAATLVAIVAFSMTEGVGLMLLLPTLEAAGMNLQGQSRAGYYARMISDGFASVGLHPGLLMLLGIFVALIGARAVLGRIQNVAMYSVEQRFEDHLRRRLYRAIIHANWLFICRSRASDFTHALTAEVGRAGGVTFQMVLLGADLAMTALYLAMAFALSAGMTAVVLASGGLLALLLRNRTEALHRSGIQVAERTKSLYASAIEHLQSLKAARTYGAERRSYRIFSALSEEVAQANVDVTREHASASAWFELGSVAVLGAAVYVSVRVLAVEPAAILILLVLFARIMPRFMSSHHYYRSIVNLMPSFANVLSLEQRCIVAAEAPSDGPFRPVPFTREIRLEGVSFAYREGAGPALRDVDLLVPAGRIVGIVGASGAGKSTIADLVMGLLLPDSGRITVDGEPLGPARMRAWRQQIGYVSQETLLFHDSVRANLLWARPDAGEDQVRRALKLAAADFVFALPERLDTVVGDRGIQLSEGERQRLAVARAFMRDPALLILDEATNSLDSDNESKVLGAVERLRGRLTVLLIAHRLSTIRWADLIYVVEGGSIVESGCWDALCSRPGGRFRALWEAQSLAG